MNVCFLIYNIDSTSSFLHAYLITVPESVQLFLLSALPPLALSLHPASQPRAPSARAPRGGGDACAPVRRHRGVRRPQGSKLQLWFETTRRLERFVADHNGLGTTQFIVVLVVILIIFKMIMSQKHRVSFWCEKRNIRGTTT